MQFFLDTGSIEEIRQAKRLGILAGVTTNPSLLAKEKGDRSFKETIQEICEIVQGPVSAEVVGETAEDMIREGREIMTWHEHVVIKVPISAEGLAAISTLTSEGARVNTTLIFNVNQALLAARAGAAYVSPFIGRLDDHGAEGMDLISEIRAIYDNYDFDTEILAASIRNPQHVKEAALAGADCATIPPDVFQALFKHPLTERGLQQFMADWAKTGQSIL